MVYLAMIELLGVCHGWPGENSSLARAWLDRTLGCAGTCDRNGGLMLSAIRAPSRQFGVASATQPRAHAEPGVDAAALGRSGRV